MFRKCILSSTVPHQWKEAGIKPVPEIAALHQNSDYRPISTMPVHSRLLECIMVRKFLYPALTSPPASLVYANQYAFRPTGSTTAALVAMLQSITDLLTTNSSSSRPWIFPRPLTQVAVTRRSKRYVCSIFLILCITGMWTSSQNEDNVQDTEVAPRPC